MTRTAGKIYYWLSGFALLLVLFLMQSQTQPEVQALQAEMKSRFAVGVAQVWGDQPYLDGLESLYLGTTSFFEQSADTLAFFLASPDADQDIAFVFNRTYADVYASFTGKHIELAFEPDLGSIDPPVHIPLNFMSQQPLANIVPEQHMAMVKPVVSGAIIAIEQTPVNKAGEWVTIQDNFTGQKYCLALYNGEANKYLGSCKQNEFQ